MLRDIRRLDYREIAERQGIPEGTGKARIHQGRRAYVRGFLAAG
ncbi:sigma factor-like helix-turn-helix DNA-binding protein [Actinoplanes teichomyceticus]|nr:sigma factor-like helix-turn-helix DNA-binding protein [Actinoplanes teichomyceticus]GIF17178.1 hypothetical protein Ate01nite_72100 [Actinoplanes teichomyceticus]